MKKIFTETFNEKEQLMLRWIALRYQSEYWKPHEPLKPGVPFHIMINVQDSELASTFNLDILEIHSFFLTLEKYNFGQIKKSSLDTIKVNLDDKNKFFEYLGEHEVWFFEFKNTVLETDLVLEDVNERMKIFLQELH